MKISEKIKNISWYLFLGVTAFSVLLGAVTNNHSFSDFIIFFLNVFASGAVLFQFLFREEIHLGGFSLRSGEDEQKIYFLVGFLILWIGTILFII